MHYVGVLWVLLLASMAMAQEEQGLDIERFKPALDSQGLIMTEAGQGEEAGDLNLGLYFHYSFKPLVVTTPQGLVRQSLVETRVAASVYASMGIADWLTLGLEVPVTLIQTGEYLTNEGVSQGLTGSGLGDIRILPKFTVLNEKKHGVSMAFLLPVAIPSGDEGAFLGSHSVTFMPGLALSRKLLEDKLLLAVNFGSWMRSGVVYQDLDTSHEFYYRMGARFQASSRWSVMGEVVGSAKLDNFGRNRPKETPLEGLLSLRVHAGAGVHITAGGGLGVLPGWGTPNYRAFLGVLWSPRHHDGDGDGIVDEKDRCPDEPGAPDNGGCPWKDTDGDGFFDNVDACPKDPGPAENKGCPWGDADADGLTDDKDKCINQPGPVENEGCPFSDEDADGIKDRDDACPKDPGPVDNKGCPWGDSDKDGIKDNVDKCPRAKEDKDGFEDEDGCPDDDNDKDGVPDAKDKCPDEPETINGYKDKDGCPDKGKVVVIIKKEKIEILQKVFFASGKARIKAKSFSLLNQVAQTLIGHEEIKKIRVEGHTDARGSDRANLRLSQRRADSVRRYLIKRGVLPQRLQARGLGETMPISSNKTARGREQNRRVEFIIVGQE
jgi:outer membrane protein OmpA-like peptidoglycan-associated protein